MVWRDSRERGGKRAKNSVVRRVEMVLGREGGIMNIHVAGVVLCRESFCRPLTAEEMMMSPENDYNLGEPIPLETKDEVAEGPKPVGPASGGDDLFEPLKTSAQPSSTLRSYSAPAIGAKKTTTEYKRSLNKTGQGASRVRVFHTKLADTAMSYLEGQINDWLDNQPEVEVKFSNTTVGMVEGKRSEPHLIITVWY
jgi:hypothetical protein